MHRKPGFFAVHGLRLCAGLALLVIPVDAALAAFQRMGIAAGTYRLGPQGSRSVPAFCFDQTRSSPSTSDRFDAVLTDQAATVKVGGRRMSLQQALARGVVQVHGTQRMLAEYMRTLDSPAVQARMNPNALRSFALLRASWVRATPIERLQMERAFAPHSARAGDHTRLRLSSRSDQPVEITFTRTALLGTAADRGLAVPDFQIRGSGPQHEEQDEIWRRMTRRHQTLLARAGYRVQVDGRTGSGTVREIRLFQRDHGLPRTGSIDADTERTLSTEGRQGFGLRRVNSRPERSYSVLFVSLNRSRTGDVYQVHDGEGPRVAATSIREMILALGADPASAGRRVFLVPRGLSARQVRMLAASAGNYSRAGADTRPPVGVLDVRGVVDEAMFERTTSLDLAGGVVARTSGEATVYEKLITFRSVDGRSRTVRVVSTVRSLLEQFLRNLQALFSQRGSQADSPTPAQLIALALEQTRRDANLSHAEMAEQMRLELANTQFARAELLKRLLGGAGA